MEDHAIVELFFARQESAITETAKKYGRSLRKLAKNITGNEQDAEECVNDTYLAVWKKIPPTRPSNYYAFLCRITRNLSLNSLDYSRAKKRCAEVISLSAEMEEILSDTSNSEIQHAKMTEIFDRFLRTLDEDTRLIFIRRYFYGDSLPELASLTGIKENNIYARLFRARKRLAKMLAKEGNPI